MRRGTRLEGGHLCILEAIDAGGMGEVYVAWHEILNDEVVVKVSQAPAMEARFRHEIELQNKLGAHPQIVAVKTAGRFDGRYYLMMEYVPGVDLGRYVAAHGPLPWREACAYARQAALGLAHAHDRGVVHRDLKPSNLIRNEVDRSIKILDWGLARRLDRGSPDEDARLTQPDTILGTPDYIAPEQVCDPATAGPAGDLYSLGCTLHELLTGRPPFRDHPNKLMAHLEAPIPALPAGHGVPTEIEGVLRRLLAKRPEDRYRSAREFVKALDDAAPAATDRHPTRRWPPKRRHVVLAAGLIAAVAACSMIAMLARPDRGQPPKEFATKPLTLSSLAVGHYRVRADKGLDDLGAIGPSGEPVRVGDDVRVELVLSEPAYAYLLALNTDGTVQLCLPESDDQPPPRADRLVLYPSDSDYFTLKEGPGVQGFVAVASRRPLPAYRDWGLDPAALHWSHAEGAGVWRYAGEPFTPDLPSGPGTGVVPGGGTRGVKTRRVPEPFVQACQSLRNGPGVEAIRAVAFPVRAAD